MSRFSGRQNTPKEVPGNHTFLALAISRYQGCGIDKNLQAWCFGEDAVPVSVARDLRFASITASDDRTCGILGETGILRLLMPAAAALELRHAWVMPSTNCSCPASCRCVDPTVSSCS